MNIALNGRVVCARLDSMGDVLLAGPAVRAVAATAESVTMLVGPDGAAAARLLPGVDDVIVFDAPWSGVDPCPPPTRREMDGLVDRLGAERFDAAFIFTSFHQSSLPLALLLRMAGVGWTGAVSDDFPGSLLDLRLPPPGNVSEAIRMLALVRAAGVPPDERGSRLAIAIPKDSGGPISAARSAVSGHSDHGGYVVVHPGAAVPARRPAPHRCRAFVQALVQEGFEVVVTAGAREQSLGQFVAGTLARQVTTPNLTELAGVLSRARVAVIPNTGPAHLAAAVGTPVVSLFAPVVPAERWAPHGVATILLGDQLAPCRATRARRCPVAGHPCLDAIDPDDVVRAVRGLWRPDSSPLPTAPMSNAGSLR